MAELERPDTRSAGGPAAEAVEPTGHAFEPVKHRSLPEAVLVDLRRAIINRKLASGERLVESELAEQFRVSRATIREALRQLEFEGLVVVWPRRGAVIAHMSSKVALDVCEVRGILEGFAARSTCTILSREQLQHMRRLGEEMGSVLRDGDIFGVVELDIAFHTLICESCPNNRLYTQWSALNALHGALMSSRLAYYHYDWELVINLHSDLCSILALGNPDRAEAAVRSHYFGTDRHRDGEPVSGFEASQ